MVEFKFNNRHYHLQHEMYDWCEEKFGQGGWASPHKGEFPLSNVNWVMDTIFGNTFVYFKYPEDATMFALRWPNG
jgi:hypothetical protein